MCNSLADLSKTDMSMATASLFPFLPPSHRLTTTFRSFPKSWASPHASVCIWSNFSSASASPAPTRSCKLGASRVYYMVDAYLLNLRAELTWQSKMVRGMHMSDFFEWTTLVVVIIIVIEYLKGYARTAYIIATYLCTLPSPWIILCILLIATYTLTYLIAQGRTC